jgi:hypothetical protein
MDGTVPHWVVSIPGASCTYYPFGNDEHEPVASSTSHRLPVRHAATRHGGQTQTATVAQTPAQQLAERSARMDRVVGLDEQQLVSRLGTPVARDERHPGTSWVYRDWNCRLEIALYPDVRTHAYKALSYEVTSNADTDDARSRCTSRYAARVASE